MAMPNNAAAARRARKTVNVKSFIVVRHFREPQAMPASRTKGRLMATRGAIFVNGALAGAGASLLCAPAPLHAQTLTDAWTGYAGIGDYAASNGNTAAVVSAAHALR